VGSGGMSTVYRAFDETLERWVAIKLLHRSMSDDSVQLERFRREARTVARLSHPHIVTVIDAGEDGGTPYIVAAGRSQSTGRSTWASRLRMRSRLRTPTTSCTAT